jgi:hypothetical protein
MGVEDIGPKRVDHPVDRCGKGADFRQFAQRGRQFARRHGTVEIDAVDRFTCDRRCALSRAGNRRDLPPARHLRGQDRPCAERVPAMQRQAMVEDMEDSHVRFVPRQG